MTVENPTELKVRIYLFLLYNMFNYFIIIIYTIQTVQLFFFSIGNNMCTNQ